MYKYIYIYIYVYIHIYIYIIHIIIIYYVEAPAGSLRRWPGTGPAYYRCIYIYIYIYICMVAPPPKIYLFASMV